MPNKKVQEYFLEALVNLFSTPKGKKLTAAIFLMSVFITLMAAVERLFPGNFLSINLKTFTEIPLLIALCVTVCISIKCTLDAEKEEKHDSHANLGAASTEDEKKNVESKPVPELSKPDRPPMQNSKTKASVGRQARRKPPTESDSPES
jgi:hypothetical protein